MNKVGIRIIIHNIEIKTQEGTLNTNMVKGPGERPSCTQINHLNQAPVSHEFLYTKQVLALLIFSYMSLDYHHFEN